MPIIYLRHPVHGTKIASAEAEAVYDEGSGWKRYDPAPPEAAAPVNAMVEVLTVAGAPEPEPEVVEPKRHPLDHDGDGKPGGSLPGPRRRRRAPN